MKMKIVCGMIAFALSLAAWAAFENRWEAGDLAKWQGASPEAFRVEGRTFRVNRPLHIEKKIPLTKGQYQLLKLSFRTAESALVAPFSAVALFQGGNEAGNHYWNNVVQLGVTPGPILYESFLTVPADANELVIKLNLGENGNRAGISEVTLSEVTKESLKKHEVRVTVNPAKICAHPTDFHFGANVVGNFPGIEAGCRPAGQPGSQRAEFLQFLKETGLRSARYPGGTESHWFLPENLDATKRLFRMSEKRDPQHPVSWEAFKTTMKEAGVKVIYQLNTSFFLSESGEILPIDDTAFPRRAGFSGSPARYAEAAAALERNFKNGVFKPGDVDYWELGNEEYAYMSSDQYAKVCAAFIPVIVKYDPGKPICVTGFADLPEKLKALGVWEQVTGVTTHYPYASWPRATPAYMTADYASFANADVRFPGNIRKPGNHEHGKKVTVSETSVYNLFTYDSWRMQAAFAMGFAIARNWPELLRDAGVDMAVFHDFESPYFGLTRYDSVFSELNRQFSSLNGKTPPPKQKGNAANWYINPSRANSDHYFPRQYVTSPGMIVLGMLAEFSGGSVAESKFEASFGLTGNALAGTNGAGKPQLFVSNPLNVPVLLRVAYPGLQTQDVALWRIDTDCFGAALTNEYRQSRRSVDLRDGRIILPARSISLLTAK